MFGTLNLVVESASSTSEIVYDLLCAVQTRWGAVQTRQGYDQAISKEVAVALMAGIIGDTGSFRYPSTSPKTFLVAHDLYLRGAKPSGIVQELFGSVTLPALRLQSEALSRIQLYCDGRFAEVLVTEEMISRVGAELLDADSLAERGRDVQGVCVSALFKQDGDIWRVSLRSRSPQWDVSVVARSFGGGGHKAAAAFRWRRDLESLQTELRGKIQDVLDSPSVESP
jgi:phosphoesterase RecJ-like protein